MQNRFDLPIAVEFQVIIAAIPSDHQCMPTKPTNYSKDHSHSDRLSKFELASTSLSQLDDLQMQNWLDQATTAYTGIGGTAVSIEISGVKLFAKRVSVTSVEMQPENLMSTRNIFGLPPSFHYGIVSLGFGAWRELACHTMTTNWVLAQKSESFPLLCHWRILQNQKRREPTAELKTELGNIPKYWNNLESVSLRLKELEDSTTHLILFLEHIPNNLYDWLNQHRDASEDVVSAAIAMVERSLRTEVPFMTANGLLHLDAHSKNILTDGNRLYFSDFGLAMSTQFELSSDEKNFAEKNALHDSSHTISQLVNWLATNYGGSVVADISSRNQLITDCANGAPAKLSSESACVIVERYAAIVSEFNKFYAQLFLGFTETPFPEEQLQQAWSARQSSNDDARR